jgi:hypothetical protein
MSLNMQHLKKMVQMTSVNFCGCTVHGKYHFFWYGEHLFRSLTSGRFKHQVKQIACSGPVKVNLPLSMP